jgi:hypothetical protein
MEPQKVSALPGKAKPGTDALDPPRGWAEGLIWPDRLVSALATASKGYIAIAPSRLMGCSPFTQPMSEARHSRCGNQRLESRMRENRTYGSEGGEGPHPFPTPIKNFTHVPHVSQLKPS